MLRNLTSPKYVLIVCFMCLTVFEHVLKKMNYFICLNMFGKCWDYSGSVLGHVWNILGNVWKSVGNCLGSVGNIFGTILGTKMKTCLYVVYQFKNMPVPEILFN